MDNASAATPEPRLCPFLRALHDGQLADPIGWPDQANACTALGDAAPQSLRQQEYACLASAHVNCPRFVRGVHLMVETAPTPADSGLGLTPAILGALLVLAASFALSVGFVVANGGMDLPAASASPQAGIESAAPSPAVSTAPAESAPPAESAAPSVEPSAQASVEAATATPTTPAATSTAATATPLPSSDRYVLLEPCGDEPDCWIYTVRQGDNLVSIARYFGVPFEVVRERNPWTETTPLVAGQELRLPPPTR
jgi:LysM repeat protein